MTAKHTPGPWRNVRRRDGLSHGDSDNLGWDWDDWSESQDGGNIPPEPTRGNWVKEADARLVAAAPDLLAALESAADAIDQLVKIGRVVPNNKGLRDARAAIAKATGAV